jgi:hypothetical protein
MTLLKKTDVASPVIAFGLIRWIAVRKWVTFRHTLREASLVQGVDVAREGGDFGVWQHLNQK